jgi:hypothetical protein
VTIGILDEFLRFRLLVRSFAPKGYVPDEIGGDVIKDDE